MLILYEDKDVIAVDKPAGVLSQPDSSGAPCISDLLLPMKTYALHRLDRNVTGAMLLARTRRTAAALSEAFREQKVIKHYLAVVPRSATYDEGACGRISGGGTEIRHSRQRPSEVGAQKYDDEDEGGGPSTAVVGYRVLATTESLALLAVCPHRGTQLATIEHSTIY